MLKPPRPAPTADAARVLVRVAPARIAELHAIVEGHDDLAVIRTLRPADGLVEARVSPGREAEFERLRIAMAAEGLHVEPAGGEGP